MLWDFIEKVKTVIFVVSCNKRTLIISTNETKAVTLVIKDVIQRVEN